MIETNDSNRKDLCPLTGKESEHSKVKCPHTSEIVTVSLDLCGNHPLRLGHDINDQIHLDVNRRQIVHMEILEQNGSVDIWPLPGAFSTSFRDENSQNRY